MEISFSNHIPEVSQSRIESQKSYLSEFVSTNSRSDFLRDVHQDNFSKILFDKFQSKKHFVQVGFGGSSLGTESLINALNQSTERSFHFLNNIDPDFISDEMKKLNLTDSIFYVVSKSGGTHETLVLLSYLDKLLSKEIGPKYERKNFFAFCTEGNSFLDDLAKKWDVPTLNFPGTLGGRYSLLSNVSYFPLYFSSINQDSIKNAQKNFLTDLNYELGEKIAKLSIVLSDFYSKGVRDTFLMPYSSKLRTFSDWFVQLWAESLGKNEKGFNPIISYGTTGQHSQLQLFLDGPKTKFGIFIEQTEARSEIKINDNLGSEKLNHSTNVNFQEILNSHLYGVRSAFNEKSIPFINIKIPLLDEISLTQLYLFFEVLTVLTGNMLEVDPFDQPGVELSKKLCLEKLKKNSL